MQSDQHSVVRDGAEPSSRPRPDWLDYLPAVLLLLFGVCALVFATLKPSGRDGQYAVIAPPWYSLAETISLVRDASGAVADMSADHHIVIAHSNDPRFVEALYRAGAWLVIDPIGLRGCGAAKNQNRRWSV